MKYTDRFITIPVMKFNTEQYNLTGKKEEVFKSWMKIIPNEIVQYEPDCDEEGTIIEDEAWIRLRGTNTLICIGISIKELEHILNLIP